MYLFAEVIDVLYLQKYQYLHHWNTIWNISTSSCLCYIKKKWSFIYRVFFPSYFHKNKPIKQTNPQTPNKQKNSAQNWYNPFATSMVEELHLFSLFPPFYIWYQAKRESSTPSCIHLCQANWSSFYMFVLTCHRLSWTFTFSVEKPTVSQSLVTPDYFVLGH